MQTTKDIIAKWDSLTPDQRYSMERLIWDLYDALYQARLDENMQRAFDRAKQEQEKLDHEFYERVRKKTEMDLQKEFSQSEAQVDLSGAREELQKILKSTN
jgi:hypothetical protein